MKFVSIRILFLLSIFSILPTASAKTFWNQQSVLQPDAISAGFGEAVDISGDYIIIGAPRDYRDSQPKGAAYIYQRIGDDRILQAKLTASDGQSGDEFGCAVAIDGDFAIIGAYGDDDMADSAGAVYIFRQIGGIWQQQTKLYASDAKERYRFGVSVSISGSTIAVGAPISAFEGGTEGDPCGIDDRGEVYIFDFDGSSWSQQVKLLPDGSGRRFGKSVSIDNGTVVSGSGSTVQKVYTFEEAIAPPLPYDNFNDNDQSTLWYKYAENSNNCWTEEANERLELHSTTSASHQTAMYISNQWKLDTNYDFALKTEFFHNNSDSLHSWLMVIMTPDLANADTQRFHIGAGSYMGQD